MIRKEWKRTFFAKRQDAPVYVCRNWSSNNWGTFDSSDGTVHIIRPEGRTALLVGKNGSGKSTLTDALITLLVRPGVRNYNVAAGTSQRRERNERTYLRGAFDHGSVEGESSRSVTRYLRDGRKGLYSVILGTFRNEDTDDTFTLAQILYLSGDDRVDKVYAFAREEKSIAGDLSGFTSFERFRAQIEERGFESSTTFTQYEKWLKRAAGFRDKAMDVFNQTVAVKDIQSLNGFIRAHMLEKRDWKDQVSRILTHFSQLSEAHRSLVEARQQHELLVPIRKAGKKWTASSVEKRRLERIRDASAAWFRKQSVEKFMPLLERQRGVLESAAQERDTLSASLDAEREEERQIRNELEKQGGDRLRELPHLIRSHEESASRKREQARRLEGWLDNAGLSGLPADESSFSSLRDALVNRQSEITSSLSAIESKQTDLSVKLHQCRKEIEVLEHEIVSLSRRKTNLPDNFVELRRNICEALRIEESAIPFAAELMAVKSEYSAWESSIEMVLRSLGLSLLVPEMHYRAVSSLVNQSRLADGRGRGQRLVYRRIGGTVFESGDSLSATDSFNEPARLPARLEFREGKSLVPWLKTEIGNRYEFLCCDTIEGFQEARPPAMTADRHLKTGGNRHEKDDRGRSVDPSKFVLGWDNRAKLQLLKERYAQEEQRKETLESELASTKSSLAKLRDQLDSIERALEVERFDQIDFRRDDTAVADLRKEKEALETGTETMRILRERLDQTLAQIAELERLRDRLVAKVSGLEKEIGVGEQLIEKAQAGIDGWKKSGEWDDFEAAFSEVEERFGDARFELETFALAERDFKDALDSELRSLARALEPLERRLSERMLKFLTKFSSYQNEMSASVDYLGSFLELLEQIEREDLPRHESRFKERLNEKVTQEIGFLNGELSNEARQIKTNIGMLNEALRNLEYREGTHMQLEPREVKDGEIIAFKRQLHECISGSFEGTLEADEVRFKRIEKLIIELRDQDRWREKVTDVRRWFDFFANEIVTETGEERSSYSDSAGRSGGEKAKLAFTILVAAIAYQYQIDPHRETSDRFHFVVVDEMFSKVDDDHAQYALRLFEKFGLQLLIVAPLDAKARVTEEFVDFYVLATKDEASSHSRVYTMTSGNYRELVSAAEHE